MRVAMWFRDMLHVGRHDINESRELRERLSEAKESLHQTSIDIDRAIAQKPTGVWHRDAVYGNPLISLERHPDE